MRVARSLSAAASAAASLNERARPLAMREVVSREMNSMEKIFLIDELQYRRKTDASDLSVGLQQKLSGWHSGRSLKCHTIRYRCARRSALPVEELRYVTRTPEL